MPSSLRFLWWTLVNAKARRLKQGLQSPRHAALSLVGLTLGVVWIGVALLDMMLRPPFATERVYGMIVSGLGGYTLWHAVRRVWERPEQAVDWSPVEQEIVCAGPYGGSQLLCYRMLTILSAATLKTACFVLLMWPDLRHPMVGAVGVLGGLLLVDLLRMWIEAATWSLPATAYRWARIVLTGVVACGAIWCLGLALGRPGVWHAEYGIAPWLLVRATCQEAIDLGLHGVGRWGTWIYVPWGELVVATADWRWLIAWLLIGTAELLAVAAVVMVSVQWLQRWVDRREQRAYAGLAASGLAEMAPATAAASPGRDLVGQSGEAGGSRGREQWVTEWLSRWPLLWRQWVGLRQRQGSVVVSLLIATLLIMTPVISGQNARISYAYVVGSLVFYSLVLLPANLKFDFRRDVDRMYVLKLLPLSSWKIVASQVAVPVVVLSVYQVFVVLLTTMLQEVELRWAVGTICVLLPLNVVIVVLENLMYLWYPYRLNQEGLEIFIRTTLAFTGKSILYGVGVGSLIAWSLWCAELTQRHGWPLNTADLFLCGATIASAAVAGLLFSLLVRTYDRFDPAIDIPAR